MLLGLDRGEPPVEGQSRQSIVRKIEVKALRLTRMILYCTGLVRPTVSESTNRVDSRWVMFGEVDERRSDGRLLYDAEIGEE